MPRPESDSTLRLGLDRCVKCGLCLPECPTYRLAADENESPRGRLALIEGLVHGHLTPDAAIARHLDNCLGCRRCERVCPSGVEYGAIIDAGRARLTPRNRVVSTCLQQPVLQRLASKAAHRVPTGLSQPMGRLHDLHRLARAVAPAGTAPAAGVHAAVGRPTRGKVQLFAGCTGVAHQAGALRAATRLLQVSGYDVVVARAPTCCGALSAHAGDPHRAGRLANRTRAAIAPDVDALISIASGCGVHLDAYQPPLPVRHVDVCRFLVEQRALAAADFAALPAIVAIHTPCSIENVYHGGDWVPALLELIPDCQLVRVGEPGQCCGAAGDHMLRRPTVAATLRKPLLDEIGATGAAVLVTGNVGCAMHLAAGFACDDSRPEVLHPVELLARACSHAVRQLQ